MLLVQGLEPSLSPTGVEQRPEGRSVPQALTHRDSQKIRDPKLMLRARAQRKGSHKDVPEALVYV